MPQSLENPPPLIIFDIGGVLLRICRSWPEGCRAAGLDLRDGGAFVDDPLSATTRNQISRQFQIGRIDNNAYFTGLSAAVHNRYSPAEIERIHYAWLLHEYPRVGEVIDRIHARGIRTAALSNTNHAHWPRMREFPAVMKLQQRLASHELGLAKPDEPIYRAAENQLGVQGHDILFFDDLPENVETAQRIGWRAVRIDHTADTAQQIEAAARKHGVAI